MTYKEREQKKVDKIFEGQTEIDTPIVGNTLRYTRGWQVTCHSGYPIMEKQKVIILEFNGEKPIIFTLEFWKRMNKWSKTKWDEATTEVQGKDVFL